jgi:carbonic anhydrase
VTLLDLLMDRNNDFVDQRFSPQLKINPSQKLMIIGCVDPRVDPTEVLGLELGEAAVIRNVGGRVTPATIKTIAMLGKVGQANGGGSPGVGWNLIVLHHTDCGMTDLASFPGRQRLRRAAPRRRSRQPRPVQGRHGQSSAVRGVAHHGGPPG